MAWNRRPMVCLFASVAVTFTSAARTLIPPPRSFLRCKTVFLRRKTRQARGDRVASGSQGRRAGLSRGLILDAAVDLVDSQGLDGLSMRKLGAALGVEAMTLYHYVPNKAALLDGLVEWVLEHSATAPALADGLSWDRMLRRYAETLRTSLLPPPGFLLLCSPAQR